MKVTDDNAVDRMMAAIEKAGGFGPHVAQDARDNLEDSQLAQQDSVPSPRDDETLGGACDAC